MQFRNRHWFENHKTLLVIASMLIAICGVLTILEAFGITDFYHKQNIQPVIQTTSPAQTLPTSDGKDTNSKSDEDTTGKQPNSGSPTTNSDKPPASPSGNFVSNHHPNLDGSPAPSQETSVCNTTPGATCYISFSKGTLSTKLPSQKTNSEGSAYWTWDVSKAGLTTGEWTITAVAQLNGKSKSSMDPMTLTIAP